MGLEYKLIGKKGFELYNEADGKKDGNSKINVDLIFENDEDILIIGTKSG